MSRLSKDTVVIHGRARGLDSIAARVAKELKLAIDKPPVPGDPNDPEQLGGYPARWHDELGRLRRWAGPERNTQMLVEGEPDICWAWHNDLARSRGTLNMVTQCMNAAIPVVLYIAAAPTTSVGYELGSTDELHEFLRKSTQPKLF